MNRWWGCEIRFGAGLDDLFGVDHNKQMAASLSNAAKELYNSDRDTQIILEDLGVLDGDPIYEIVGDIRNTTRAMVQQVSLFIKEWRRTVRSTGPADPGKLTAEEEAEQRATADTSSSIEAGEAETDTDRAHKAPESERQKELEEFYREAGAPNPEEQAATLLRNDFRYGFLNRRLYGPQMFGVDSVAGELIVSLNIDHPLHQYLEMLEQRSDDLSDPLARSGAVAIRTLLLAWARLEDQIEDRNRRTDVQDIALDWGKQARGTLDQIVRELESEAEEES